MSDVNLVEVFVDPSGPEIIEVMSPGPPGPAGSGSTDASQIVSGTLAIARGGTGLGALGTALQVLRVNADGTALEYGTVSGGGGLSPIASSTILGNGLGDTAIPQALNANSIRTILGLATFNSPSFAGLTLSGLQQFTGTSTVGLRVKSLTTAEYELLTPANGDLFRDSTTDRIDARLARGTVELVDTAGGQTINGNLAATALSESATAATGTGGLVRATSPTLTTPNIGDATATILRRGSGTFDLIVLFEPTVFSCSLSGFTSQKHCSFGWQAGAGNAQGVATSSSGNFAFSTSSTDSTATRDTNISRASAGVAQVGTTANNALGSLLLTNLTASGTITASSTITAPFFRDSTNQANYFGGGINARNTWLVAYSVDGTDFGTKDLSFSRSGVGVLQIGNGTANASGSLLLTNLTASGIVTTNLLQVGGAGGFFMRSNGSGLEARDTTNSALGQIWSSLNVTGAINRATADAQLDIYISNMSVAAYKVRIGGTSSLTNSSGVGGSLLINSILNQTGTAGSTDFCINRTETALGSGSHNFADFQVGGSSRFSVSNTGNVTASGTVRLGTFTVGTLPSASANTRAIAYVTDSSVSTYGSVVVGGGSTQVMVLSNGTDWLVSGGGTSGLGTFTKAQLDTAVSDGNVLYVGDAPTAHVHAGTDIATGTVDPARLGSGSSITTKFLRGDSTWQTISGGGDALVANSLDQFADVTQTAGQTLSITSSTTLSGGTHSGTNTGDNAVNSLYSGLVSNATHTGDVTGATALTIANGAVTLAKTTGIQKAITSGTAAPSGGADGDIYLQYT